jgi:ribonuclease E
VLRDVYSADVNRIVTDTSAGMKRVKQHLSNWSGGQMPVGVLIDHHRERTPILEYFRVNAAIREALKPRVDLPSGGYVIIEPTEALTVIDVNSGSFTRSATARETVLWTNCEAATEIARQLRLRNVAGVIIVDFIDMDSRRDKLQVLEHFNKALRADKSRPQISQLSELGLVELTRKRQGQNIYELFGRSCPTCGGLGHLVHLPGDTPNAEGADSAISLSAASNAGSLLPASLKDTSSDGLEPHQDLQELELINHPSYQDKLGKGNSRRRRRRDTIPSRSNGKEAPIPKDNSPSPSSRETSAPPLPGPADGSDDKASGQRSSRGRVSRSDKRQPTPPQVITVEMTADEQRVYAEMGISPLVLADENAPESRNTLISVVLPGEKSATAVHNLAPTAEVEEFPAEGADSEPQDISALDEGGASPDEETTSMATVAPGATSADTEEPKVRRRRRRRSSASEDSSEE